MLLVVSKSSHIVVLLQIKSLSTQGTKKGVLFTYLFKLEEVVSKALSGMFITTSVNKTRPPPPPPSRFLSIIYHNTSIAFCLLSFSVQPRWSLQEYWSNSVRVRWLCIKFTNESGRPLRETRSSFLTSGKYHRMMLVRERRTKWDDLGLYATIHWITLMPR